MLVELIDVVGYFKFINFITIFQCNFQSLEKDQNKWIKRATVKEPECQVQNLKEGREYHFRVSAFNEVGLSDPKEATSPILMKDTLIPPSFDLQQLPHGVVHVRAGSNLDLEVAIIGLGDPSNRFIRKSLQIPYCGKPAPRIKWIKDDERVKAGKNISLEETTPRAATLKIRNASQVGPTVFQLAAHKISRARHTNLST